MGFAATAKERVTGPPGSPAIVSEVVVSDPVALLVIMGLVVVAVLVLRGLERL